MGFVFASWNVEAFRSDDPKRIEALFAWLAYGHPEQKPIDVFGIMEVESTNLLAIAALNFPQYDFHLTDGAQNKEIVIGVRRDAFDQVAFTQRREFKSGNAYMRPGSLVSLREKGAMNFTHLVFLHAPAMSDPDGFGARAVTFENLAKLKSTFDAGEQAYLKDPEAEARIIALGDFNTAGLRFPSQRKGDIKVTSEDEIAALEDVTDLKLQAKSVDETWIGGRGRSDLDHVMTSGSVSLRTLGDREDGQPFVVSVRGWPELEGAKRKAFQETISDHALLIGEVLTGDDADERPRPPQRRSLWSRLTGR